MIAFLWFIIGVATTVLTLMALGGIDVEARFTSQGKCANCGHEIEPKITVERKD